MSPIDSERPFRSSFRKRPEPFVPTTVGLSLPRDVALPSCADAKGFWSAHFGDVLKPVTDKEAFLDPEADSADCRQFLDFVGVAPLSSATILNLAEESPHRSSAWWADVYRYLATHDEFSRWGHQTLAGRRLLLTAYDEAALQVPADGGPVVLRTYRRSSTS